MEFIYLDEDIVYWLTGANMLECGDMSETGIRYVLSNFSTILLF